MNEVVNIITGIPFGSAGYVAGPGFVLVPCPDCGYSMWLGPKQQEKVAEGVKTQCMTCLVKEHGPDVLQKHPFKALAGDSGSTFDSGAAY